MSKLAHLSDRDLLEQLVGRRAPLALLLEDFQSLGHVLAADPARLADYGVPPKVIDQFQGFREVARRLAWFTAKQRRVVSNHMDLMEYVHVAIAHETTEQLRVIFLDTKNALIADEVMQQGTVSHTAVYPRQIVKRALMLDASALIIVHNHPSGDPKPSRDDIDMTRQLQAAAEAVGLTLNDHIVVGHRHAPVSFRAAGLL